MKNLLTIAVLLLAFILSCSRSENELELYLNNLETDYETLCRQAGSEVWAYYTAPEGLTGSSWKDSFSVFLLNDTLQRTINDWYARRQDISNDTLLRRLELWHSILTCAKVDFDPEIVRLQDELESRLADYTTGQDNNAELENDIRRLIRLRNAGAGRLGYGNYANLVLQSNGIDTLWFGNFIRTIDSCSAPAYEQFILKHITNDLSALNYEDLRNYLIQSAMLNETPEVDDDRKEELLYSLLAGIGINARALPMQFGICSMPPGIGGFGNSISIPDDFRAVVMKELSFYYLLHEAGHGLQGTHISTAYPVLKGYEWCTGNIADLYNEAMAETVARFSQNKSWMMANGYSGATADSLQRMRKELFPLYLREQLILSLFEIELYRQPEKDPAVIKNELYKKYLLVDKDFTKRPNLIRLSYVAYPVYEQNYFFADILSLQIHNYLEKEFGEGYAMNPEVGPYLSERFWKDGEFRTWQERMKRATGKDLDLDPYLGMLQP